uniref:Secreted protein n=1 Tax=Talaromyces marneffei PM1 TaxID=1077442 RepID=A0A093VLG5_TALMA
MTESAMFIVYLDLTCFFVCARNNGFDVRRLHNRVNMRIAATVEVAAARVMLNRTHSPLPKPPTDSNAYELDELDGN